MEQGYQMDSWLSHYAHGLENHFHVPFAFPMTSGLEVDSKGFFSGDWLSLSFSVRASQKLRSVLINPSNAAQWLCF